MIERGEQEKWSSELYKHLSDLMIKRGNYAQALTYCQEGIMLSGTSQQSYKKHLASLYVHQALATALRGQPLSAEIRENMQKALAISKEVSNPDLIISVLGMVGEIEIMQGDGQVAETLLGEAVTMAEECHCDNRISYLLSLLGEVLLQRKAYVQAEMVLHKAWLLAREQTIPESLARISLARGELFLVNRHLEAAHAAFQEGGAMREANPLLNAQASFGLARVAAMQGREAAARNHANASLKILETMGSYLAETVRTWLASPESFEQRLEPASEGNVSFPPSFPHAHKGADHIKPSF